MIHQEIFKLVSYKICPFVVRSQIVAEEKGIELNTVFIDLENKPEWFTKISPTQSVPVLIANEKAIFESSVICEFIDGLTPESLFPDNSVLKHFNKSWIEFISTMIFQQYNFMIADNKEGFGKYLALFEESLKQVEKILTEAPFFNGTSFSIIDATFAPLACRLFLIKKLINYNFFASSPKVHQWSREIMANKSVRKYLNDDFEKEFIAHLNTNKSWMIVDYQL